MNVVACLCPLPFALLHILYVSLLKAFFHRGWTGPAAAPCVTDANDNVAVAVTAAAAVASASARVGGCMSARLHARECACLSEMLGIFQKISRLLVSPFLTPPPPVDLASVLPFCFKWHFLFALPLLVLICLALCLRSPCLLCLPILCIFCLCLFSFLSLPLGGASFLFLHLQRTFHLLSPPSPLSLCLLCLAWIPPHTRRQSHSLSLCICLSLPIEANLTFNLSLSCARRKTITN